MVTRYQHLFKTTLTSVQFISKYDIGSKTLSRRKREKLSLLEKWPWISEIYRVKSDHQLEPSQDSLTNWSMFPAVGISNLLKFALLHSPLYY